MDGSETLTCLYIGALRKILSTTQKRVITVSRLLPGEDILQQNKLLPEQHQTCEEEEQRSSALQ